MIEPVEIGMRVVVRYRLDDGRATDALGVLLTVTATELVVDGKRGPETIQRDRIIAAKRVPAPPAPRPAL